MRRARDAAISGWAEHGAQFAMTAGTGGPPHSRRPPPSSPAKAGRSRTPRPIHFIADVSGILDRPHSRTMTVDVAASSTHFKHAALLRGAMRPGVCLTRSPFETRARGMPGAQCTRSLVCAYVVVEYAHQYSQRRHRKHPAFPTQWFTTYSALFPGTTALLTPSSARRVGVVANLTPASGRQNHTASPSATRSARLTPRRVHRIPPHVRDDRETPLASRWDGEIKTHISEKRNRNIFCERAGQDLADGARRANHLTKNIVK